MFDSTPVWRIAWVGLLAGCASVSGVQLATPVEPGKLQVGLEPGLQALGTSTVYPHLDVALRYGVSPRLEVGARSGWSFLEAHAKVLLTRPGKSAFVVSAAPTMGGVFVPAEQGAAASGYVHIATPVLFGFGFGGHQLVVGLRSQHFVFVTAPDRPSYVLGVGGSLGVAFRLNASFVLMPEVSFLWPAWGGRPPLPGGDVGVGLAGVGIGQFKLGFLLDRQR